jgi:paraquat-inducible protein A
MKEVRGVAICEGCDAVYRHPHLRTREVASCLRCGTELERHRGNQATNLLPLAVASLILFAIANLFPIVEIELGGLHSQTTLAGAVVVLSGEGLSLVALLVLATTLLFPLVQLCILCYLLVPLQRGTRPAGFSILVRMLQTLRPWGMIEVFLLGVLVAIVKLAGLASVIAGPALWAFAALTVLLTQVVSFNPRAFWEMAFKPPEGTGPDEPPPGMPLSRTGRYVTAVELRLCECHHCGACWSEAQDGEPCGRCGTHLRSRKPDSIRRTWAFLMAAAIMYLPANLLPVMITQSLLGTEQDTIMSGIIYFWVTGSYELAAVVFTASFLVPLFKLAALFLLALLAQRRSDWRRYQRAQLYRLLELIGRWSMLDVFVVSLLAGLVRLQGFAEITAAAGIAAFASVVVLTMLSSICFDPRLTWEGDNVPEVETNEPRAVR